jgi:hypothetical protein
VGRGVPIVDCIGEPWGNDTERGSNCVAALTIVHLILDKGGIVRVWLFLEDNIQRNHSD